MKLRITVIMSLHQLVTLPRCPDVHNTCKITVAVFLYFINSNTFSLSHPLQWDDDRLVNRLAGTSLFGSLLCLTISVFRPAWSAESQKVLMKKNRYKHVVPANPYAACYDSNLTAHKRLFEQVWTMRLITSIGTKLMKFKESWVAAFCD